MEPRPDFFPVYVSGQYLTSEHLNETHNFLWQEEKAGRYLLAGNGIVNGLKPDFSGNPLDKVSVTAGAAGTTDGYIIQANTYLLFDRGVAIKLSFYKTTSGASQLMEKTDFDKIADKAKANIDPLSEKVADVIELLPDSMLQKDLPDNAQTLKLFSITSADALSGYLVFAWVFIKDAENNHCQQGDCNTKGMQRNFITRYFLIKNNFFTQLNTVSPAIATCTVNRIKMLCDAGSAAGLNQKAYTAWNSSVAELAPYFSANANSRQLSIVAALLDTDAQTQFTATATRFTQIVASANQASCMQYYNLFTGDLAKAINELVVYYNDFASKYPVIGESRVERCSILGSLRQTGIDKWRYYFIPAAPQLQYKFEKGRLKSLLQRVFAMVNNFTLQTAINAQAAQVTPKPLIIPTLAASDALLQNCAIPYYYDVLKNGAGNEVLANWNVQGGNLGNVFCYYDSKIPGRDATMAPKLASADWYNYNFFRVEGHIGMNKAAAFSALKNLININGIPIQLLDCDIDYKGPQKWITWYNAFVMNVTKWAKDLRKDYEDIATYNFGPVKYIQEAVTQTSYRDVDQVVKIYKDFTSFNGVMYNPPGQMIAKKGKPQKVAQGGATSKVPASAYQKYMGVVKTADVEAMTAGLKDAMAEQTDLQSRKMVVLSDLTDLEYMGGALRGGTFVLLHSNNVVIGDGCLPYYYRINQIRVYNPTA